MGTSLANRVALVDGASRGIGLVAFLESDLLTVNRRAQVASVPSHHR